MSSARCFRKDYLLVATLLPIAVLSVCHSVFADGCSPNSQRSEIESYVLQQVANGEPARLSDFPVEKRVLSASFLQELLTSTCIKVHPRGINIEFAEFREKIDLENRLILHNVSLTHCIFQSGVDAEQSHFAESLVLDNSIFIGAIVTESATVRVNLVANDCKFGQGFFKSTQIGGDWIIRNSEFLGSVDATQAIIKGNLLGEYSQFYGNADFDSVRVKGDGSLRYGIFSGRANFTGAQFANLYLTDSTFNRTPTEKNDLDFTGITLNGGYLDRANYHDARVTIERMTFQYLSPASWEDLKRLARDSEFNAEFYAALEAMLRNHGYPDQADSVFFARKEAERTNMVTRYQWSESKAWWAGTRLFWAGSVFEEWFVGYGHRLEYLLGWSILLFLPGYFVFRDRTGMDETGMNPNKSKAKKDRPLKYSGFWYALDLFLPIIKLGDADNWMPKPQRRWALRYRRLHIILGNILVPIGLAAWTGIIK